SDGSSVGGGSTGGSQGGSVGRVHALHQPGAPGARPSAVCAPAVAGEPASTTDTITPSSRRPPRSTRAGRANSNFGDISAGKSFPASGVRTTFPPNSDYVLPSAPRIRPA